MPSSPDDDLRHDAEALFGADDSPDPRRASLAPPGEDNEQDGWERAPEAQVRIGALSRGEKGRLAQSARGDAFTRQVLDAFGPGAVVEGETAR